MKNTNKKMSEASLKNGDTGLSNKIVIYTDPDGNTELRADVEKETVWASLDQIASLFNRDKSVISRHLHNIYSTQELQREATVAKNATVQYFAFGQRKFYENI